MASGLGVLDLSGRVIFWLTRWFGDSAHSSVDLIQMHLAMPKSLVCLVIAGFG